MTSSITSGTLQECNLILAELGNRPKYEWKWSEDLWVPLPAQWIEGDGGIAYPSGPRKEKLAKDLKGQWVVAYLHEIGSKEEWEAVAGVNGPLYPGKALWIPCSSPNGWCAMQQGWAPTALASREFVGIVKRDRNTSAADDEARVEERRRRRREEDVDAMAGVLDRVLPVRPWIPGSRSHPVWHRSAKDETALVAPQAQPAPIEKGTSK